jgi:hypothetical protein
MSLLIVHISDIHFKKKDNHILTKEKLSIRSLKLG